MAVCPVCSQIFSQKAIESHVDACLTQTARQEQVQQASCDCPMCGHTFSVDAIQAHVECCLEQGQAAPLGVAPGAAGLPRAGATPTVSSMRGDPNRFRKKRNVEQQSAPVISPTLDSFHLGDPLPSATETQAGPQAQPAPAHDPPRAATVIPQLAAPATPVVAAVSSMSLPPTGFEAHASPAAPTAPVALEAHAGPSVPPQSSFFQNQDRFRKQRVSASAPLSTSDRTARTQEPSQTHVPSEPEWWWLSGEQHLPVSSDQWKLYYQDEQRVLTAQYIAMKAESRTEGLLADLGMSGYQVRRASPSKALNKRVSSLVGRKAIAGLSEDLWNPPPDALPPSNLLASGKIVSGFFQVRREDNRLLEDYHRFLSDSSGGQWRHGRPPKRRVVLLIEPREWSANANIEQNFLHSQSSLVLGGGVSLAPPRYWTPSLSRQWQLLPASDVEVDALKAAMELGGTLGGRDMRGPGSGSYTRCRLVSAWRLQHPGLWGKYAAERENIRSSEVPSLRSNGLRIPAVEIRKPFRTMMQKLPGQLDGEINEMYLSHGSKPENILAILSGGLNERFSQGIFGHGTYLAEDVAKNDQYCTVDERHGRHSDLHRELFDKTGMRHEGALYYVFFCRVVMGYYVRTSDGSKDMDNTDKSIWSSGNRELSVIQGSSPPVIHHSLIAETGVRIQRFREFILFHGDRIYPEYLVAYKRQ
eukprot:TRINITY_DN5494_c0_g1_i1.p1 TRINITY_DN5494_c0_g1~~TRINITY_DN5494_c0_g1_i1.p1  ORF type:complete len:699 (-),score=67.15 TRINITY_DN5494_c0_g1_i1:383-2479(-)